MKVKLNKAIEYLLARGNLPILFWLKKDILEVPYEREFKNLQKYAARIRILESQKSNGGWCKKKYEGHPRWKNTHYIHDTLWNSIKLYHYGCLLEDEGVKKAIDFLFSTQTEEGDFRGAYLNEYAPTYHALTLEVMSLFGVDRDERLQKAFKWLMKYRQEDGGWVIPYRTISKDEFKKRYNYKDQMNLDPVEPDKSKPFSHLVTGMVLRAMAASSSWRKNKASIEIGEILMSRFFKTDKYDDRRNALYWEEICFPFWATDILSSLDALSLIGFTPDHKPLKKALNWLLEKKNAKGYWESGYKKASNEDHLWVTLAVLRILKRFGILDL
ncbi:MAG: terpene cyclase/mutase family protein [Candidatus Aminicenantes bacterium]|nr:terpene cyclase/mutase family protein [Candidatus Aminicenantes bacterium]